MIAAPAVGLMVVGALKLLGALKILLVFGWGANWLKSAVPGLSVLGQWDTLILFGAAWKMIAGLLIFFGGYRMLRRQSYAWAIAAAIISVVACSLLGLPVGIWALIVLARQDVSAIFNNSSVPASAGGRRSSSWSVPVVVIAFLVLFFAMLASIGFATVRAVETVRDRFTAEDTIDSMPPLNLQKAGIYRDGREFRKDSTQTFPLDANGQFSIDDVNGRIEIQGWNSNLVVLNTVICGKTAESVTAVEIAVNSVHSRVAVRTRLPSRVNDFSSFWDWFKNDIGNASVDYTVHVPLHARLENASTVNGTVAVGGMANDITASTVNGTARVKNAAGNLTLSTVNGTVTADMDKLGQGQSVALNTVNGQIKLALPDTADANFSIGTVNGGISSDFSELAVKKQWPLGSSLNGKLGSGAASVKADTVNGTIEILKVH